MRASWWCRAVTSVLVLCITLASEGGGRVSMASAAVLTAVAPVDQNRPLWVGAMSFEHNFTEVVDGYPGPIFENYLTRTITGSGDGTVSFSDDEIKIERSWTPGPHTCWFERKSVFHVSGTTKSF